MPFVNIKITPDDVTAEKKAELIKGVTDLLKSVLKKRPETTVVVIEEVPMEGWGIGGLPVEEFRRNSVSRNVGARPASE